MLLPPADDRSFVQKRGLNWVIRCRSSPAENGSMSAMPPIATKFCRVAECSEGPIPEVAEFYSITSSAVASSVGGMVSPSALAVVRLIAVSNLVGACTGRSAGFAPRRIRST